MADLVSRIYGGFRGADFRGEEIHLSRSPDCLNVWKDYKETESIRTRPGMELRQAFDAIVYGIFFFKDEMIVHSGTRLYGKNWRSLRRSFPGKNWKNSWKRAGRWRLFRKQKTAKNP